jgi:hypothetical protein
VSASQFDANRLAEMMRRARPGARPRPDCPSADQIWAALHREVPTSERERIIDHTGECAVCAEAWQLAMEIEREGSSSIKASPGLLHQVPTWARIAAAVLVVAAAAVAISRWQGPDPQLRQGTKREIRSLLPEDATLKRDAFVLRWDGAPEGARYDLVVTTVNLEVVADVRDLDRPEYRVDPGRLRPLAAGTRLLWRVVAHPPDGSTWSSPTTATTLQD